MASPFGQGLDPPKKGKVISSAFESESFDADGTIHVPGLVGSATISPSGRDVAIASPEGLAIIDLDSPYSPPRRLSSHGMPWLVVDVQWSPFAVRDYWVASTANHRCLVWNLNLRDDSPSGAIEHSLQAHTRAITDINFSAHHADLLATCAVDGYVHCWDLRRPRQPALTFCDWFAGATQVKYNRQDAHILASSHDRWLHIWDDRKAVEPLKSISAHTSKIYGLDWNRTRPTGVVTCSLDKSIKFWDYNNDNDVPERVIRTDFPVWRARHTPFGKGLLAMPQTEPGNLYLYDRRTPEGVPLDGHVDPVAIFPGHGNHKVKEFLWRSRGGITEDGLDMRDFQLVSWGENNELRLQRMDSKFLECVGYYKGRPAMKNLNLTRQGAAYKTFRTVDDSVHRDRRHATMSDPRPASGGAQRPYRSALTMALQSPRKRVGLGWRGPSMRSKLPADKAMDRSQLQIGWMKGITLARRKDSTATPSRPGTKGSGLFSPDFHDHHWAEPETIQDEFLRISNQLPNVSWEGIDMDALLLNASLKGPWGPDGEAIFIKVKVDIPASYPRSKAPKFTIEQTSFMPDATRRKLEREINDIANQFLKRKANCLDVVFSYLLGEVDLEASTTLFKNVRDLDDDLDALADESSSEDDENDLPGGGSASMSQELTASAELDPSAVLASGRRTAVPPPPRLCGAQFANDGRLVCFFPTKEQKVKALFSLSSPDSARERSKGQPSFAGFGRLGQDSPHPRPQYAADEASATEDQGSDSDASVSSTSSSDSDSTTLHEISLWRNPGLKFRKTWSANESVRSSGGGTGAGTGTGTGTSRKRPGKPKNVVSLHDFRDMLPSKKQFAEEYAIFGDGAEVCKHNASVASKYGYPDLVSIWEYAALLLRKGIPLELHERLDRDESVLVIARDAVSRTRDEEAADEPSFSGIGQNQLSGRVKWGYHPLARDFIEDLFDYFERLADIQMLAMLSCVFGNSSAEHSAAYAESRLTQRETPLPMKAPSFSLEYFPTDPSLWNSNYKSQVSSAITTPRTAHTPAMYSDSPVSEDLAWPGDMAPRSSSHAETPPKSAKDRLREPGQTQSLSTSPESRTFLKSHPAVAALAASIPRPLAHALSRSPPEPLTRKKPSPADTSLSNPPPTSVTWGGSTVMGGAATDPTGPSRASMSDDGYRRRERVSMVPMCISYIPENQHLFDDDGWLSTSFIPEERDALCASYRYAYAEMLQVWGQPLARLEIMKFNLFGGDRTAAVGGNVYHDGATAGTSHEAPSNNTETDRHSIRETGATSPNIPLGSRKEQLQALLASDRGLDVTGICRVHEIQLDPLEYARPSDGRFGGAVGTCHRCHEGKVPQTQLRCVFCAEPIDALYPACLNCGCASHEDCLAEWHEAGETECPAGDECVCVLEANHGQVESWQALRAAITSSAGRRAAEHLLADDDDEDHHGLRPPPEDAATHRARRTSVPARIGAYFHLSRADEDGDSYDETRSLRGVQGGRHRAESRAHGGGDRDADEESTAGTAGSGREDWESVSSSQGIPSLSTLFGGKPAPVGQEPVSAARLSLGNRLKKPLGGGEAARPASLRRKSGGVAAWKKSVGLG